ncbi:MAG: hypothetical protein PQJ61_12140 [Spirochaetales bacterium]|uniref:Uncharacterized protein n=1 Tax=Candidatus Thalassospirochaeta sargassi TaxID=3119039 RepID=A0AAJ1IHT5_9SPIO|nr:hypothetical protein [Spirochaetales bacterium]
MEENNETIEFWAEKEQQAGKPIIFKSFARFIGESGKGSNGLSGLLYATDERVYFEDFEKSSMLDMFMKKKRKYEKFTMNFLIDDTVEMRKVSESSAVACINGEIEEARPQSAILGLFNSAAWEVKFNSGNSYFFELFEPAELVKLLGK